MALVDRIQEFKENRKAVWIKNLTINEPFFQGHYVHAPMMPDVRIVWTMRRFAGLAPN